MADDKQFLDSTGVEKIYQDMKNLMSGAGGDIVEIGDMKDLRNTSNWNRYAKFTDSNIDFFIKVKQQNSKFPSYGYPFYGVIFDTENDTREHTYSQTVVIFEPMSSELNDDYPDYYRGNIWYIEAVSLNTPYFSIQRVESIMDHLVPYTSNQGFLFAPSGNANPMFTPLLSNSDIAKMIAGTYGTSSYPKAVDDGALFSFAQQFGGGIKKWTGNIKDIPENGLWDVYGFKDSPEYMANQSNSNSGHAFVLVDKDAFRSKGVYLFFSDISVYTSIGYDISTSFYLGLRDDTDSIVWNKILDDSFDEEEHQISTNPIYEDSYYLSGIDNYGRSRFSLSTLWDWISSKIESSGAGGGGTSPKIFNGDSIYDLEPGIYEVDVKSYRAKGMPKFKENPDYVILEVYTKGYYKLIAWGHYTINDEGDSGDFPIIFYNQGNFSEGSSNIWWCQLSSYPSISSYY